MNNAKKQKKTAEWERLEISSRKLEISREHFMQGGAWKRTEMVRTEAIKNRWWEYKEEWYKIVLRNWKTIIVWSLTWKRYWNRYSIHLEGDILKCEIKWALGSITTNKASGSDRIPAEFFFFFFKSYSIMLLKCCIQYVTKFGKLNNLHRTGKDQLSFQSQRRAMPKNVQATIQLSSLHMLPRLCSKSFQLGFSSTWSENYQTYNLNLEKVVEPEIKLRSLVGTWRNQKYSRKNIYSASLTMLKSLIVWIIKKLENT